MNKSAFLFPGQGSQSPGMGREIAKTFPEARQVFEKADAVLGFSLSRLCFEGPEDQLRLTANSQPAILTVSVAIFDVLRKRGFQPDFLAGHSLGEYSALVAANSLSLEDGLQLVRKRGKYMQEAVPTGKGSMAALIGLDPPVVEEICQESRQAEVVSLANFNSSNQIVISGHVAAVARAMELAKRRGARRVLLLNVNTPFHCSLMKPAEEKLAHDLDAVSFQAPAFPLINNVDARLVQTPKEAREGLKRQVSAPVQWLGTMRYLSEMGVLKFLEVGPGKVLTGLLKQFNRDLHCEVTESVSHLYKALEQLETNSRVSA